MWHLRWWFHRWLTRNGWRLRSRLRHLRVAAMTDVDIALTIAALIIAFGCIVAVGRPARPERAGGYARAPADGRQARHDREACMTRRMARGRGLRPLSGRGAEDDPTAREPI